MHCGVIARFERKTIFQRWKLIRLIEPHRINSEFSDYEATYNHAYNHYPSPGDIPRNIRPQSILNYIDPAGFLISYHYFLPQHEIIKVEDPNGRI